MQLVSMQLALELFDLADMCGLLQLKEALGNLIIEKLVTPQNLLIASLHLELHEAKETHTKCLRVIDNHASKVLESDPFLYLSRYHLSQIVSRDSFFANEAAILHAVGKWLLSNDEMPDDALNEALLQCIRVTQIDLTALESDGDMNLFLMVSNMKSSNGVHRNEYPRGRMESEISFQSFQSICSAERNVATRDAMTFEPSQQMQKPLLVSELLDNTPSVAVLIAFNEQYLISGLQFHGYHSQHNRLTTSHNVDICNKCFSYKLEVSTDKLPPQWRCIVDFSNFRCRGEQKVYFTQMGIK